MWLAGMDAFRGGRGRSRLSNEIYGLDGGLAVYPYMQMRRCRCRAGQQVERWGALARSNPIDIPSTQSLTNSYPTLQLLIDRPDWTCPPRMNSLAAYELRRSSPSGLVDNPRGKIWCFKLDDEVRGDVKRHVFPICDGGSIESKRFPLTLR
jgi:hypothetical protein